MVFESTTYPLSNCIKKYMIAFEFIKLFILLKYHPKNCLFDFACFTSFIRTKIQNKQPIRFFWFMLTVLLIFALVKDGVLALVLEISISAARTVLEELLEQGS